jgi:hypothetical protein
MSDTATTPATASPASPALDPGTGLPVAAPATDPVTPAAPAVAPPVDASAPAAPAAPAAPSPAPATDPAVMALLEQLVAKVQGLEAAQPAAAAPEIPDNPPSDVNLFAKGHVVRYAWNDPYDGPSERFGLVVDTLPDEGAGARSVVAWFANASGPIGDHLLTAV